MHSNKNSNEEKLVIFVSLALFTYLPTFAGLHTSQLHDKEIPFIIYYMLMCAFFYIDQIDKKTTK